MKAVILFSGGVDSTVVLAMALKRGLDCTALSFNYGQRHKIELKSASAIAQKYDIEHKIIHIDPAAFSKSSLTNNHLEVPKYRTPVEIANGGIPNTYVPARNTLFLAYALGQAEIINAHEIHVGFNALDYNPYPDCRPEYLQAFQSVVKLCTRQAVEGHSPTIIAPLIKMDKTEIFRQGRLLHAPLEMTFSCYDPNPQGQPCGHCDACVLRSNLLTATLK